MTPEEAFDAAMRHENRADPYPFFDELRKTPVVRVTNGIYAVTGYEEVMALAHDPRVSSDLRKGRPPIAGDRRVAAESMVEAPEIAGAYGQEPSFIAQDPPEHDRARRQCMRFFGPPDSPDLIPGLEPTCQRIVNELLDKATGKTRIDVVDEFAYPLPVNVICRIMGVPIADEPQFHAWIADIAAGIFDLGPDIQTEEGRARRAQGEAANAELNTYIIGLVEKAEKSPGPGMISQLVHDDGPDGRMSRSAIVSNTILLFVAGHDSTVNLISHCVLTVLRNPWSDRVAAQPAGIDSRRHRRGASAAVLGAVLSDSIGPGRHRHRRHHDPPRRAHLSHVRRGQPGSAALPRPQHIRSPAADNEHVGWGRGIHVCFGGPLARLEVNTAFEAFLRRVENPRLVEDPPPYRISQVFRGPRHLLIDYDQIRP